ncbi:hypothetical protein ACHAXA_006575 [Cyclostephanos tholiformis]|uniref:DUF5672 domain-containing protein n=1 Tax=Cyclostephanos tholiformis TaxID=382380 RepID=A0ABD3RRW0_9STRA
MKKAPGGMRGGGGRRNAILPILLAVPIGLSMTFNISTTLSVVSSNDVGRHRSAGAAVGRDADAPSPPSKVSGDDHPDDHDYDEIYASFGTHESYSDRRIFDFSSLGNYTSPDIVNGAGCRVTVSIVDPRPPASGYNHPVWFMLESVATYAPYACVVFHTASCGIDIVETTNVRAEPPTSRQWTTLAARSIYDRSLPSFRRMMEGGLVRVNILDGDKYGTGACDDFGNGNGILLNARFWSEEFVDGVDGDMILTAQPDSVLCHDFDVDLWRRYAYVGAPWAGWIWNCDAMRERWYEYAPKCNGLGDYRPDVSMSLICTRGHGGLQGNGGFSLRNRRWMVEAIRRCPSEFSGLKNHQIFGDINEDVYFSTVLNALNATMPSALEASLFSVESIFLEQLSEQTGPHAKDHFKLDEDEITDAIKRLWGKEKGMLLYNRMHVRHDSKNKSEHVENAFTIPLALHQPWNGIAYSTCGFPTRNNRECAHSYILSQPNIMGECKFLKYIYNHRGKSINK